MAFLSHLSPIPSFPPHTGPYKVGTQDVEVPISETSSPAPCPEPTIPTVSFRIFYPAEQGAHSNKAPHWLPNPQGGYFQGYAKFLGSSPRLATFFSYLPIIRPIFYTTIPAITNAKLASTSNNNQRWPVMIFSHGLGGTRNGYSHLCGALASHGMVVVAPEHRDGSAPISYINSDSRKVGASGHTVGYLHLPHNPPRDELEGVEDQRMHQMRIRCWELGLIHDALLKLDGGNHLTDLVGGKVKHSRLSMFASALDVHTPGRISWAGHSYGAATMVQFFKSIYYPLDDTAPSSYKPLYNPSRDSALVQQITPSSPIALLDLWAPPVFIPRMKWLSQKPLPAYDSKTGSPPIAIISEAFFKWRSNLEDTKRALLPANGQRPHVDPHIFYPVSSAHLSQSDFGLLYPYLTKKFMKAIEPERTMRLNVRAILENLRRCGIHVADTSAKDMELSTGAELRNPKEIEDKQKFPLSQDHTILATEGSIKGWITVPPYEVKDEVKTNGFAKEVNKPTEGTTNGSPGDANGHAFETNSPGDAVMKGEVMK